MQSNGRCWKPGSATRNHPTPPEARFARDELSTWRQRYSPAFRLYSREKLPPLGIGVRIIHALSNSESLPCLIIGVIIQTESAFGIVDNNSQKLAIDSLLSKCQSFAAGLPEMDNQKNSVT